MRKGLCFKLMRWVNWILYYKYKLINLDNLPGEPKNDVFSLVSDEVRLDVHNNAPDWLGGLNGQVKVNLQGYKI